MFGLGRKQPPLLGIDISTTAVKLIELSHTPAHSASLFRVQSYAVEPLPNNAVVEKKITDVEAVGDAVRKAVVRSGSKTKTAAVAVASSAVITKTISMPATLNDAEMEAEIELEADQYIPYPLDEVNIDFDVIGTSTSSPDMVDVLLAASRGENVDDRVSALDIAGLTATIVDVEAYAMETACALILGGEEDARDQVVVVADVGATTTTFHALHNGRTVYTREQNFGGLRLIEEVQQRYALAREEALKKVVAGGLPEQYATDVLGPFKEALAQQVGRALQFFYSSSTFNKADRIILAGGSASIPHLEELVEQRLGIPTTVANPFSRMSAAPRVQVPSLSRDAPGMMVAVGLALRGFD